VRGDAYSVERDSRTRSVTTMTELPAVTTHAKHRFEQRVGTDQPLVANQIRRAYRRGRETTVDACPARVDPETGAAFLVQNDAIVTVYRLHETRLQQESAR
jgi:hypothetical protein